MEDKNFLPVSGIKPQFLSHPTCTLVTTLTELPKLRRRTEGSYVNVTYLPYSTLLYFQVMNLFCFVIIFICLYLEF
jgi:hypothetical protein